MCKFCDKCGYEYIVIVDLNLDPGLCAECWEEDEQ